VYNARIIECVVQISISFDEKMTNLKNLEEERLVGLHRPGRDILRDSRQLIQECLNIMEEYDTKVYVWSVIKICQSIF